MKKENRIWAVLVWTIGYRIFGFLREVIIAKNFGGTIITDAYFIATSIPNVILELFAVGGISSAVIPILISQKENKLEFKKNSEFIIGNFLIIICFILFVLLFYNNIIINLIAPGFSKDIKLLTTEMSKILILIIPIIFTNEIYNSFINCFEKTEYITKSHFYHNLLIIIIGILLLENYGIYSFVYAILIGSIFRIIYIYIYIYITIGFIKIHINFKNKCFLKILKLLLPIILASLSVQLNFIIDRMVGSKLSIGTITYLTYSNKLIQLPLGIFLGSAVIVFFPILTNYAEKNNKKSIKKFIKNKVELIIIVMGFIAIFSFIFAEWIISIVFQRGEFGVNDVKKMALIFKYYSFTMLTISITTFFQKIFYSFKNTKIPMLINMVCVIINGILTVFFSRKIGAIGISLGTFIASFINMIFLFTLLKKKKILYLNYFSLIKIKFFLLCIFIVGKSINIYIYRFFYLTISKKILLFFVVGIFLLFIYIILIYMFFPYKRLLEKKEM